MDNWEHSDISYGICENVSIIKKKNLHLNEWQNFKLIKKFTNFVENGPRNIE